MRDRHPLSHDDLAAYSHEFKGVLTVIAGYTELLRRPLDDTARQTALDGIERAIQRADALCSDALAGRAPLSFASHAFTLLSLSLLAEQAVDDQRNATGRTIDLSAEGTARILGDADALTRVLGNLIDNAAKYSLSHSSIEVRVAEETGSSGQLSVIEVADRGPGIPDDEIARVVEPFTRLERDAEHPGTGLGLSIVNNVVAAHSGRMSILARKGGGTVVRLEFPSA